MTVKVLVCRVGEDPKVEEVSNPFHFLQYSVLNGDYLEEQRLHLGNERIIILYAEDALKKLPFNRNVAARCPLIPKTDFVVDTRDPKKTYAKPGEVGYYAIKGSFLITKVDPDGEFDSLSDLEIQSLFPLLLLEKCERCKEHPVAYPGAKFCGAACSAESEMNK